jgi:DNA adenine methylase
MTDPNVNFLRYPGGKQRLVAYFLNHLPTVETPGGRWVEPFVGGGSVFFARNPDRAVLSDLNGELIDLYRALRQCPTKVYRLLVQFPASKSSYYDIRNRSTADLPLPERAARTLFLNRTCFKGMWRYRSDGQFNVGFGGEDRRPTLTKQTLVSVSYRLRNVRLQVSDFERVIDACKAGDILFCDPPYRPGKRGITDREHYFFNLFTYEDQARLARALDRSSRRGVRWATITSSHPDILALYSNARVIAIPKGTGRRPGILTDTPGEVLIFNYEEQER